jgi:hypothetical protein
MTQPRGNEARKLLTPRQAEYLAAVREHYAEYGTPLSARWVCERMGTAS